MVSSFGPNSPKDPPFLTAASSAQEAAFFSPREAQELWYALGESDQRIVDRIASDFYERSLRYAQSQAIESQTAALYASAEPARRSAYREQRRDQWQSLNPAQRDALRGVKRPTFLHLSENQKWPFRVHALNELGATGAIQVARGAPYGRGI